MFIPTLSPCNLIEAQTMNPCKTPIKTPIYIYPLINPNPEAKQPYITPDSKIQSFTNTSYPSDQVVPTAVITGTQFQARTSLTKATLATYEHVMAH